MPNGVRNSRRKLLEHWEFLQTDDVSLKFCCASFEPGCTSFRPRRKQLGFVSGCRHAYIPLLYNFFYHYYLLSSISRREERKNSWQKVSVLRLEKKYIITNIIFMCTAVHLTAVESLFFPSFWKFLMKNTPHIFCLQAITLTHSTIQLTRIGSRMKFWLWGMRTVDGQSHITTAVVETSGCWPTRCRFLDTPTIPTFSSMYWFIIAFTFVPLLSSSRCPN